MSTILLAEAKLYLEVAHTAQDARIQNIIDGAEQDVEDFCGIKITSARYTEYVDGGGFGLWPTNRPVTAVTSVTDIHTGEVVEDYTIKDSALYLDTGARWPDNLPGRWEIVYTGGNATIPAKIQTVVFDLIYRMYHNRGGKGGQSSSGYSVDWAGNDSDLARRLRRFRHGGTVIG